MYVEAFIILLTVNREYVRSLFDAIASRYDLLNHLLSGGVDWYWRWRAVRHLPRGTGLHILDVATGTGDLALAAVRAGGRSVVGVDIAEAMLARGREKIRARGLEKTIQLQTAAAEALPFPDGTFDAAMVAFGARNFEDLDRGLAEMRRVLKSGGIILVLEFSRPSTFPFRQLYLVYFRRVLPWIGRLVSGHHEAYTYLPDTVMKFPEREAFLARLTTAGFDRLAEERLTFGIATIYHGVATSSPNLSVQPQP